MYIPAALLPFETLRLSADWTRWGRLAADAPPFLSPEFFDLIRPLAPAGVPLVAEAWSGTQILGALPLVLDKTILRSLRSHDIPSYDYCGTPGGIEAIWACLREDPRWSELALEKVPTTSLLATRLLDLARRDGHPVTVGADSRHPFFALQGFEKAMNPKFRSNLVRCERKAGGVVFERLLAPSPTDLAEAMAMEAKAWKGANGTSIAADPRVAHVYEELGRLLGPCGRAALSFVRAGGKRIAMLFTVEDQHTLFALKIGFDPDAANLSPGHLMILEAARDAEQRGLKELDFVGHEDEWKLKWTNQVHEHLAIRIYARNARGLVRYGLRELVKPRVRELVEARLPETVRTTPRSPLPRRCQRADIVGAHSSGARIAGRLDRGLGIKTGLRRMLRKQKQQGAELRLGEPSMFPVGSWVRVRDRDAIKATLDDNHRTRGLEFVTGQWEECGRVYRVQRHVRRLRDDHGRFRAVSRTVLLDGSDCSGHSVEPAGCGRHCPMMYRDEWLEAAEAPRAAPAAPPRTKHARVRSFEEIAAGLDAFGRRDGVTFMPEMAAHVGKRFAIAGQLREVYEYGGWIAPPHPLYILAGVQCTGALTGCNGPCDRACALMWHEDWLIIEPDPTP